MGLVKTSTPECARQQHCSEWARKHMKHCLCSTNDGLSLSLGVISVISWGVAEIPQIMTNYREKSTEGLSIAFLITWIIGDLFNLFGCKLEPATLPTQYYMAMLYTITTSMLTLQTLYYAHIYPRLKSNRQFQKAQSADVRRPQHVDLDRARVAYGDCLENGTKSGFASGAAPTSPIPLPAPSRSQSRREFYYMSARSLTKSSMPAVGSFPVQRQSPTSNSLSNSIEEPLLGEHALTRSAPTSNTKSMLCVVSTVTFFLGSLNLELAESSRNHMVVGKSNGVVIRVGRKLLQVSSSLLLEPGAANSSSMGTYLGWGMAAIYMGGRLPQICLNIRRGNVEGLNPLMFVFALIGNATYVASILVSSTGWSKIKPNLPWLVDAGGCVLLDTFILFQFIYFRYWSTRHQDIKIGNANGS